MSIRLKRVICLGLVIIAATGVYGIYGATKPVGGLSRNDVRQIRAAINEWNAPWRTFTWANRRFWPTLLRMRLSLRVTGLSQSPIGSITIYPDGTRVKRLPRVTVFYKAYRMRENRCTVVKQNAKWIVEPQILPNPGLFLFRPSNSRRSLRFREARGDLLLLGLVDGQAPGGCC